MDAAVDCKVPLVPLWEGARGVLESDELQPTFIVVQLDCVPDGDAHAERGGRGSEAELASGVASVRCGLPELRATQRQKLFQPCHGVDVRSQQLRVLWLSTFFSFLAARVVRARVGLLPLGPGNHGVCPAAVHFTRLCLPPPLGRVVRVVQVGMGFDMIDERAEGVMFMPSVMFLMLGKKSDLNR